MTTRERLLKTKEFLLILSYYLGGYFIVAELTLRRSSLHHLALPFEKDIPFYPAFIFAYVMIFGVVSFAYVFVEDLAYFRRMVRTFFICTTLHFFFFLLYPVEYTLRPVVDPAQGWAYQLVYFYYWLDLPVNCFPSMHVSNSFLVAFLINRYHRVAGIVMFLLAFSIAVSVVLVKQHYIADVVVGFFVAWGAYVWEFRERPVSVPEIAPASDFEESG